MNLSKLCLLKILVGLQMKLSMFRYAPKLEMDFWNTRRKLIHCLAAVLENIVELPPKDSLHISITKDKKCLYLSRVSTEYGLKKLVDACDYYNTCHNCSFQGALSNVVSKNKMKIKNASLSVSCAILLSYSDSSTRLTNSAKCGSVF